MTIADLKFTPKYYDRYINLVDQNTNIIEAFSSSISVFDEYTETLIKQGEFKYQPEKWTVKEVLQHIIDTERIFAYRALALSRSEPKTLIGFDENLYAKNSNASKRTVEDLLQEFKLVRQSNITLFKSFSNNTLSQTGICSDIKVSVLAIGFTIIGHAKHHLNILKERYIIS
ncbi:DinB family protein [Seonamhaeicola sp. MEBiC1930]|uniref:DinB family protein n=1 Tax=Seonamhaeicola sp. MEBiC01930 TaxID=2976768 RepID=UPI003251DFCF